jgi:mono/diheme cytochrome c family protein
MLHLETPGSSDLQPMALHPFHRIAALLLAFGIAASLHGQTPESAAYTFDTAHQFLKTYCATCHGGKGTGGLSEAQFSSYEALQQNPRKWESILTRVRNSEMPPRGAPAPTMESRESFTNWVSSALVTEACSAGMAPGPAPVRRLNRTQYASTVRDLLNLQIDVSVGLPGDGGGGEGFDNAAETLFLSPIHAEKYLDAAKLALTYAAKDPRSRARFLIAKPGPGITADQAARQILDEFLPRAFRRPAKPAELQMYQTLFDTAQANKQSFDDSILYALSGVLISPQFLFRAEPPNPTAQDRLLDDYSLASRLSYFLWNSTPDSLLLALADDGILNNPQILKAQIARMLRSPKSFDFAQNFVEQWLGTRVLGEGTGPDAKLFPAYAADAELRGDIRLQPVIFFRELLMDDQSLLNLIDSKFTITTKKLQKLYGPEVLPPKKESSNPQRVDLPEGSNRGGLLGMSAILMVSSHPQRSSPVLRGKFLLDAMLGTPPPPPPMNVPPLEESTAAKPRTVREILTQHRANPVCASCHARIDPLGFALENYDAMGVWRNTDAGKPVDASGELPDGTKFEGPAQLKKILLEKRALFLRNLTNRMLGYALGRGLTRRDSCVVNDILSQLEAGNYSAQTLIQSVVLSMPFRYQAGTVAPSAQVSSKARE